MITGRVTDIPHNLKLFKIFVVGRQGFDVRKCHDFTAADLDKL